MGIKHLNRFFKENVADSMKFVSLSELSGKKIAVDISIYMYKYASENSLIENMYLMLAIFKHYDIIPIFIFDGNSPIEKMDILKKRSEDRHSAREKYAVLNSSLDNCTGDNNEKQEIMCSMDALKRQMVYISKNDTENIKSLIRSYGATYYDAPGEADELCALLTIKGKVWACLSEDMDMFVYGCPRVIRYLSLLNHTGILYEMSKILSSLGVTQKDLREICILSGTDYNSNEETPDSPTLYTTLKYFKKYHKSKTDTTFYSWIIEKTDYIKDFTLLQKINKLFDVTNNHSLNQTFEDIMIENGPIKKNEMHNILKTDGFIFPVK